MSKTIDREQFPGIEQKVLADLKQRLQGVDIQELLIACLVVPYLDDLDRKLTETDAGIRMASKIKLLKALGLYDEDQLMKIMDTPELFI